MVFLFDEPQIPLRVNSNVSLGIDLTCPALQGGNLCSTRVSEALTKGIPLSLKKLFVCTNSDHSTCPYFYSSKIFEAMVQGSPTIYLQ